MITAIQNNTSFNGITKFKSHKIARQVVKMDNYTPKGLTKISRNELNESAEKFLLCSGAAVLGTSTSTSVPVASSSMNECLLQPIANINSINKEGVAALARVTTSVAVLAEGLMIVQIINLFSKDRGKE